MLTHTNKLYDKHFGPHPRYDPAHAPRLMQKKYLQELQEKIPDAFEQTSAAHARWAWGTWRNVALSAELSAH
jgi:hypothetical protein